MADRLDVDIEVLQRGAEALDRAVADCDADRSSVAVDAGDVEVTRALSRFGDRWSAAGSVLRDAGEGLAERLERAAQAYRLADQRLAEVTGRRGSAAAEQPR